MGGVSREREGGTGVEVFKAQSIRIKILTLLFCGQSRSETGEGGGGEAVNRRTKRQHLLK